MLKSLYERYDCVKQLFAGGEESTGIDFRTLCFESSAESLHRCREAQTALGMASLCYGAALQEEGIEADAVAGFSAGEWSAMAYAGIIPREELLPLLDLRGRLMEEAILESEEQAMGALIGPPVEESCRFLASSKIAHLYPANITSSRQLVLSGSKKALELFEAYLAEKGCDFRLLPLSTRGAFHSPYMEAAQLAFARRVEELQFNAPGIIYFSAVSGCREQDPVRLKELALKQICSPMNWLDVMQTCSRELSENQWQALECGPGRVLQSLWRREVKGVPCSNAQQQLKGAMYV